MEWVAVDHVFLRCSTYRSVPEIFVIKVESCQKSRRNLDVLLALPNYGGAGLPKVVRAFRRVITPTSYLGARRLEKFRGDTPTSPEVIEAHTLNFKQKF